MNHPAGDTPSRAPGTRPRSGQAGHSAATPRRHDAPAAAVRRPAPAAAPRASGSPREYAQWRARQIAYGRWEPWADAAPVRDHVARLRAHGASYHAISQAACVSPATVHRLMRCARHGQPPARIGCRQAHRILAVTPARAGARRRDACGARRRLRALLAVGHSPPALARRLGVPPRRVRRLLSGQPRTVSTALHAGACHVYEDLWDQRPPEQTRRDQAAARAARDLARTQGWPPPMALDDDRIDDPGYRTRTRWRPAGPARRPGGHAAEESADATARAAR
jgi:hypothetical protein